VIVYLYTKNEVIPRDCGRMHGTSRTEAERSRHDTWISKRTYRSFSGDLEYVVLEEYNES